MTIFLQYWWEVGGGGKLCVVRIHLNSIVRKLTTDTQSTPVCLDLWKYMKGW